MQKNEYKDIEVYGRMVRVYRSGRVLTLRINNKWKEPKIYDGTASRHGRMLQVCAKKDRYNKREINSTRQISISNLLGIAFLSDGIDLAEKGMWVCHKNGNPQDDRLENLKWIPRDEAISTVIRREVDPGTRFGWLTVEKCYPKEENFDSSKGRAVRRTHAKCRCKCGKEVDMTVMFLRDPGRCLACDECKRKLGYKAIKSSKDYVMPSGKVFGARKVRQHRGKR